MNDNNTPSTKGETNRRPGGRRMRRPLIIGGIALAAVVAALASGGSEPVELTDIETFPDLGAEHIDPSAPTPAYNSNPPTSGPHAGTPAPCGIYLQVVPDIFAVHSLEHGAVVAWYNPDTVPATELGALQEFARDAGTHIIVAPRQDAPDPLVLTAWTNLLRLDGFDQTRVRAFYDQYAQAGPERGVPCPLQIDEPAEQ